MKKKIITFAAAICLTIGSMCAPSTGFITSNILCNTVNAEAAYAPAAPKIKQNGQKMTVTWDKISGASCYCVYMQEQGSSYKMLAKTSGTSAETGTLTVGKTYYFRMCAYVDGSWTSYSKTVSLTCTASKPSTPSISSVTASSYSAIVKWNAVNGVSGYEVEIYKNGKWSVVYKAATKETSAEVNSLTQNSLYFVRIRSYIQKGSSKTYSSYSSAKNFYTKKIYLLKTVWSNAFVGGLTIGKNGGTYNKTSAYDVASLINKERMASGKNTLVWDETLYRCAQIRAKEIAVKYSHYRPNGRICGSISTIYDGENIVYGYDTAIGAHLSWMGSSAHKSNVLDSDFHKVAVACYRYNGVNYWVTSYGF